MPTKEKVQKHAVQIKEDTKDSEFATRYGGKFVAKCGCGWESGARSSEVRAQYEGDEHVRYATSPERGAEEQAAEDATAAAAEFGGEAGQDIEAAGGDAEAEPEPGAAEENDWSSKTVAQLDEAGASVEGYPSYGTKGEKVAFMKENAK